MHEENQEQISLIDEVHEEKQEQIKLELSKTFENIEETKLESNGLETSSSNGISSKNQNSNKINQLVDLAKLKLCYLSIDYEQNLAKSYGTKEEQVALSQVERNSCYRMTSFFPSFKVVLNKMQYQEQLMFFKLIVFCDCGGIQNIRTKVIKIIDNEFIIDSYSSKYSNKIAMIVEGYQFQGSLSELKKILHVPEYEAFIPEDFYKHCFCNKNKLVQLNMKKSIMAVFAQHAQFTNNEDIDFYNLGLMKSQLKKEYDYLKTLSGFSINNMENLHIDHIYPNVISDEMKSVQNQLAKIKQTVPKIRRQTVKIPSSVGVQTA